MTDITINLVDEVWCVIPNLHPDHTDTLFDLYGPFANGYIFHPLFKLRRWDGKIRFFQKTGKTYINLLDDIIPHLVRWGYKVKINDVRKGVCIYPTPIDSQYFNNIIKDGNPLILSDHQVELVNALFEAGYGIGLAATNAGKSYACAAMLKRYEESGLRGVIIVPDKGLVSQTHKDLNFCGVDTGIFGGGAKDLNHTHLVTTWQTLQNSPNILKDYNMLIVDECHGARGNVIGKLIREHCTHMAHRFGVTGTLPKDPAENLSVISALGPVQYTVSSKSLIDKGWSSKLQIEIIQFRVNVDNEYAEYLQELKDGGSILPTPTLSQFKDMYFSDWNVEKAFLATNHHRMQYIADMIIETADKPKGNVLCLVSSIKFGKMLTKLIDGAEFLYGAIQVSDREDVYDKFKNEDNMKVIANAQIAATGLNIPRIFNLMYIDMGKSFIRTIQAIGRGLRKAHDKDSVVAYDICADSKYSKRHLAERVKFYKEAGYPYKKTIIDL